MNDNRKPAEYTFDPGRHIYIVESLFTEYNQPWRVYQGLLLKSPWRSWGAVYQLADSPTLVGFVDQFGAFQMLDIRHKSVLNSAAYWVFAHEFDELKADTEEDWNRRGLWREQYEDMLQFDTLRRRVSGRVVEA